jgi:tetratricopeptide (TPR) repeat protein
MVLNLSMRFLWIFSASALIAGYTSLTLASPIEPSMTPQVSPGVHRDGSARQQDSFGLRFRYAEILAGCRSSYCLAIEEGNLEFKTGHYEQALKRYRDAEALNPSHPLAPYNCGTALYELGRFDQAIEENTKAISIAPDFGYAFNNRGNALVAMGKTQRAFADYTQAINVEPGIPEPYIGMALISLSRRDYRDSMTVLDQGIRRIPNYGRLWSNRGYLKHVTKDYRGAIADYRKAITLGTNDAFAFRALADVLSDSDAPKGLRDPQQAVGLYNRAIAIDPSDLHARMSRANTLIELRQDINTVAADYQIAVTQEPNNGQYWCGKAFVDYAMGHPEQAIKSQRRAESLGYGCHS